MTPQQTDYRGILAIAGCAFLWSLGGLFIKLIDWNAMAIAGMRSLIAGIVILLWLKRPRFTWSFAQIAAGVTNAVTMLLFVFANKTTTAANAILLQYSAPVFTAIFGAWLLHEKPKTEHLVAFPFVAGGMLVFFLDDVSAGGLVGNIAAAASGLTFGLYFVFMRMQKNESPLESNLLSQFIAAAIALPIACFLPMQGSVTPGAIAAILGLGVVQIGLAAIFFARGITRITAVQAVLIALIEPIFNPVWVFLSTGEKPGSNALIGGAVIIVAVTAASIASVRRAKGEMVRAEVEAAS
ncbi:EamA domain-containing membrane protein RarD [Formivibrio citricus]|uniref:EamA domain-containing membrane protein RarD n=1 Tax=Formivibrio citricus TaxID=83765 RepID=A0A1I5DQZ8_9NEIS|nr:DMT family transporter [Formivibrio citricus]SFO01606.1 EamA domain-containing membrane protein RarD [Formivibrio citricus]